MSTVGKVDNLLFLSLGSLSAVVEYSPLIFEHALLDLISLMYDNHKDFLDTETLNFLSICGFIQKTAVWEPA